MSQSQTKNIRFGDRVNVLVNNDLTNKTLPFNGNPSLGIYKGSKLPGGAGNKIPTNQRAVVVTTNDQYTFVFENPSNTSSVEEIKYGDTVQLKLLANQFGDVYPDLYLIIPLNPTFKESYNFSVGFATKDVLNPDPITGSPSVVTIKFKVGEDGPNGAAISNNDKISFTPTLNYWETSNTNYLTTSSTTPSGDKLYPINDWIISLVDGGDNKPPKKPSKPSSSSSSNIYIWVGAGAGAILLLLLIAVMIRKRKINA